MSHDAWLTPVASGLCQLHPCSTSMHCDHWDRWGDLQPKMLWLPLALSVLWTAPSWLVQDGKSIASSSVSSCWKVTLALAGDDKLRGGGMVFSKAAGDEAGGKPRVADPPSGARNADGLLGCWRPRFSMAAVLSDKAWTWEVRAGSAAEMASMFSASCPRLPLPVDLEKACAALSTGGIHASHALSSIAETSVPPRTSGDCWHGLSQKKSFGSSVSLLE